MALREKLLYALAELQYTRFCFNAVVNRPDMLQSLFFSQTPLSCIAASVRQSCAALLAAFSLGVIAAPGQFDPTFGVSGVVSAIDMGAGGQYPTQTGGLVQLPIGSIVVARWCYLGPPTDNHTAMCLKRFTPSGQPDLSFGAGGQATVDFPSGDTRFPFDVIGVVSVALQPDGKVLAAAPCAFATYSGPVCVARFLANGSLDPSFNSGGSMPGTFKLTFFGVSFTSNPIALQSNGKIIITGQCSYPETMCVTRLTANGVIDTTFANAASGTARVMPFGPTDVRRITAAPNQVTVDSSDRIVIAGTCTVAFVGSMYPCVGRLNSNGSTDTTFVNSDTSAPYYGSWFGVSTFGSNSTGNDITVQADGKILFAGDCGNSPATSTCLVRLLSTGAPDPGFTNASSGRSGIVKLDTPDGFRASRSLKVQADGSIVFAGECSSIFSLFCVGRLNSDGSLDTTFDESPGNGNGIVQLAVGSGAGYATDVALGASNKILLYGACKQSSGAYTGCAIRLLGGARDIAACKLNVDGNNAIESATDAQLVLRYLLGFRGSALSNGAVGANPIRTGQNLETYLASLNLDVDGDGQVHAMTDGLLILRALLGLSGDALTAGAVNTTFVGVRNAPQILTWIETTHGVACLP